MKTHITNLQEGLAYVLQGLYYTERRMQREFVKCIRETTSEDVATAVLRYAEDSENKLLKLERIFNYIMQEPLTRKNDITERMMDETHYMLKCTQSRHLKDILMVTCIQNLNAYKLSNYKTAYLFANQLQLDTAADLLQEMLEWELTTRRGLGELSVKQFDNVELSR